MTWIADPLLKDDYGLQTALRQVRSALLSFPF
jgi:hypothetical protein